ncbi:energy-coupling factor transporter transmembrane component T family protein [Paenibacillus sp. GCM10012306]|uniref:energy-coupling factor transporter transmembrane component T family protein n=1 Tax=Paenibacillus sp. GCM10012306 TaxID=3317342 RepID=UPI00361C0B3F
MQLYYPSNSLLHYLHGFTKILVFGLLFTFIPLFMDRLASLLGLLVICLALFIYIRPTRWHWLLLIPVLILAFTMSLSYFLSDGGGTTYFQADLGYWQVIISSGNIGLSLKFICRTLIWCLLFFLILFTTSNEDIVMGLKKFGLPEFVTLSVSLALRYWSLMIFDVKTVMDAQYVRGVDFRSGNLYARSVRFASTLVPVLFVFLKRFRTTSFALTLKGAGRKNKRTYYYNPRITGLDKRVILAGVVLFVAFLALKCFITL